MNVTGLVQGLLNFNFTPASGFQTGVPQSALESLSTLFRASGVAADQGDTLYVKRLTMVASTPQSKDLTSLADNDLASGTISFARVRAIAVRVYWTTDNVPLLLDCTVANGWLGMTAAAAKVKVHPASPGNPGWVIFVMPQTTGAVVDSTHKAISFDPQTAAGNVDVVIFGCSS